MCSFAVLLSLAQLYPTGGRVSTRQIVQIRAVTNSHPMCQLWSSA